MPDNGPMRPAVLFDLDGVLVDSFRAHLLSWLDLGKEYGTRVTEAIFPSTFGRTSLEIIRELWGPGLSEEMLARMYHRKELLFRERLLTDVHPKEGAVELVDSLKEAGFLLAVGSSAPPANVMLSLERIGRAQSFQAVITGADVTIGKPHPRVFLLAAERVGAEPKNCAVIEDSTAGIEAALSAGMRAIALTGTNTAEQLGHAHLIVNSLRELSPRKIADLIRGGSDGSQLNGGK
ncbi:MAG: HAD family phosphatase [Syntrophobacter sp.]